MPFGKPKQLDGAALKEYAVRLLAGRALSTGELRDRLRRRASRPEDIESVLDHLKQIGFTDDQRFADHFSSARAATGSFGKQRVLSDLLRKRVARTVAEQAVTSAYESTDEAATIEAWLQRKYRGQNLPQLLKDPAKLTSAYRRLRTAGFSSGPAIKVLKRFSHQAEELEGLEEG